MEDVINMCRLCQKNTSIGGDNLFENNNGIKYVDQVLDMLSIEVYPFFCHHIVLSVLTPFYFSSRTLPDGLAMAVAVVLIS